MKHSYLYENDFVSRVGIILAISCALVVSSIAINTLNLLGSISHEHEDVLDNMLSNAGRHFVAQVVASGPAPTNELDTTRTSENNSEPTEVTLTHLTIESDDVSNRIPTGTQLIFKTIGHYNDNTQQRIDAEWSVQNKLSWLHDPLNGHKNRAAIDICSPATSLCAWRTDRPGRYTVTATVDEKETTVSFEVSNLSNKARAKLDSVPDWARSAMEELAIGDIMRGYNDGSFGAGDTLTQGQVITLLTRALARLGLANRESDCAHHSPNVPEGHYAFVPLCLFVQRGWITNPNFNPDAPALRGETGDYLYKILSSSMLSAIGLRRADLEGMQQIFADVAPEHPFYKSIMFCNSAEIMTGKAAAYFGMQESLNRAEGAVLIRRVLQKIEHYGINAL